jgi:hypothetical protein
MRLSTSLAILPFVLATAAIAQDSLGMRAGGGTMPDAANRPSLNCLPKNECIIVVNQAPEYNITGFYINDGQTDRKGQRKWYDNLFRPNFTLQPHNAWWIHRSTTLGCIIHAKVDMRARDGRKLFESRESEFDLCKDKIPYTIIQVNPLPGSETGKPTVKVIE